MRLSEEMRRTAIEEVGIWSDDALRQILLGYADRVEAIEAKVDEWPKRRKTDPETSTPPARDELRKSQDAVLRIFEADPHHLLDEKTLLIRYEVAVENARLFEENGLDHTPIPLQSESGIRTRRTELERLGFIVRVDSNGRSKNGRRAGRYGLSEVWGTIAEQLVDFSYRDLVS